MNRFRQPHWMLIILFLGILVSIPASQMAIEAARGEWPQAFDLMQQRPTAKSLRAYEKSLEDASWVAARLRPWAHWVQLAWLRDGGEKAIVGPDGWFFYRPGVQYLTERPHTRGASAAAAEAVAAVVDFRNQLAARGIRLVVVPVPNKESVYPEKLSRRAAGQPGVRSPETQALMDQLAAAAVEVVDLFAVFAAARAEAVAGAPDLYLTQDSHWSPAGMTLAAQAVAQHLIARDGLEPGTVAYTLNPAPVERIGDVIRMFQSPPLERSIPAERVDCLQVVKPDTGQPYRDEPGAEVLVLGDSFLRIYQQDEPGAAGFIAHLARALRRPVNSLVDDGGATTPVRQELFYRPALLAKKRVVVWEFVERDIRLGREGWKKVPLPPAPTGTATPPK